MTGRDRMGWNTMGWDGMGWVGTGLRDGITPQQNDDIDAIRYHATLWEKGTTHRGMEWWMDMDG